MLKAIAPYVGAHSSTVKRTVHRTKGQKPAEPQCMPARPDFISFLTIIPPVPGSGARASAYQLSTFRGSLGNSVGQQDS